MSRAGRGRPAVALLTILATLSIVVAACGESLQGAPRTTQVPIVTSTTGGEPGTSPTVAPDTEPMAVDTTPTEAPAAVAPDTTAAAPAPEDDPGPADDVGVPTTLTYPQCTETKGRVQHLSFNSQVMRIVHPVEGYNVYTPPCYDRDANRRYPTIWLLHGAQRDESQWQNLGLLDAANRMIVAGEIPPVIIILADGISAQGEYTTDAGKMLPFDFYLLNELKPRVQKAFRTLNHPFYRAIGGISRGGEWALLVAGRHPDIFGAVGGHSPAVGSPTNPGPVLAPQLAGKGLRIWLDVGTSDSLYGNVSSLDASLNGLRQDHEFHPAPGAHEESFWSTHAADYLRWYTEPWKAGSGR